MESRSVVWIVDQICRTWLPDGPLKRGRRVFEASMELEVDGCHAPLFLLLSQALKIVVFFHREWQHFEQESHVRQKLLVVDLWCPEFTRTNLSASPLPDAPLSMSHRQIFKMGSEKTQVDEIILR
jgi:hypothetical protein